jgi:pilus assembly protein Flp/PilA
MMTSFIQFAGDESGVTALEYGLIGGLISIGIVSAVTTIGTTISAKFFGPIAGGFGNGTGPPPASSRKFSVAGFERPHA